MDWDCSCVSWIFFGRACVNFYQQITRISVGKVLTFASVEPVEVFVRQVVFGSRHISIFMIEGLQ